MLKPCVLECSSNSTWAGSITLSPRAASGSLPPRRSACCVSSGSSPCAMCRPRVLTRLRGQQSRWLRRLLRQRETAWTRKRWPPPSGGAFQRQSGAVQPAFSRGDPCLRRRVRQCAGRSIAVAGTGKGLGRQLRGRPAGAGALCGAFAHGQRWSAISRACGQCDGAGLAAWTVAGPAGAAIAWPGYVRAAA